MFTDCHSEGSNCFIGFWLSVCMPAYVCVCVCVNMMTPEYLDAACLFWHAY